MNHDAGRPGQHLGGDVNTSQNDAAPMFMPQVAEGPVNFYFVRGPTTTDIDIYSAAITRDGETLGPATPVSELNFAVAGITDARPSVRRDGKEVIFLSNRPGGVGEEDLYVSTRQSVAFPWSAPMNLGPTLNSAFRDASPSLSLDGSTLVFASTRPGGVGDNDLWMSTRRPIRQSAATCWAGSDAGLSSETRSRSAVERCASRHSMD